MTRPKPLPLAAAALAALGLSAGALWATRWRFPVRTAEREVAFVPSGPPDAPPAPHAAGRADVQTIADGTGRRFRRRYRVRIARAAHTPEALMARVAEELESLAPTELATFEKTHGAAGTLALGDEFDVHTTSPWRAPVRVAETGPRRFTLATLDGHLEAGLIRFSARRVPGVPGGLVFQIESWARSGSAAVDVAYDTLGLAQAAQTATWTFVCEQAVGLSGGVRLGPVEVHTDRGPADAPADAPACAPEPAASRLRALVAAAAAPARTLAARLRPDEPDDWTRYRERLEALADQLPTYDPEQRDLHTVEHGWNVDHYQGDLPPEPPGEPLPSGEPGASWAAACGLVRTYAFPDPGLITGYFAPEGPLPGRRMLLRARFLGVTFWFGVLVGDEIAEARDTPDGPAHVWGYGYRTLAGHFEQGEITFTVWKWADTGRVAFHIDSVSRVDRIPNLAHRLGFAIFGRRLQIRFARTAVERVQRLTSDALAAAATGTVAPEPETLDAVPAPDA